MERSWVVVVPVKGLATAKSRLSAHLGGLRRDLALAMAVDTVAVAASCRGLRVVVVTDDEIVAGALRAVGAEVVTDEPRAGINAALVHGARSARVLDGEGVAALAADLPSLRRSELLLALRRSSRQLRSFVADAAGTGTTLFAATSVEAFAPMFGSGSSAAHAMVAVAIDTGGLATLQRDVDTIEDLRAAARYGLNPRTARVVTRLGGVDIPTIRPAS